MKLLRPAIALTFLFIVLTGLAFPLVVFGAAQGLFPRQANGSLVRDSHGRVVGSLLIGQAFTKSEYFHGRPSAAGSGYDANNSGGTNLGPTSDKLINGIHDPKNPSGDFDGVVDLAKAVRLENGLSADAMLPSDAVTRSGSGLDPEISVENANLQAARVAKARGLTTEKVRAVIEEHAVGSNSASFGPRRVNVLEINLALDK